MSAQLRLLSVRDDDACGCLGMELGRRPGEGSGVMLLFGQQDPRGPSIVQVTMSIKHQTWPYTQPPSPTPPFGIKAREGSLRSLGYFCSNVQRLTFLE